MCKNCPAARRPPPGRSPPSAPSPESPANKLPLPGRHGSTPRPGRPQSPPAPRCSSRGRCRPGPARFCSQPRGSGLPATVPSGLPIVGVPPPLPPRKPSPRPGPAPPKTSSNSIRSPTGTRRTRLDRSDPARCSNDESPTFGILRNSILHPSSWPAFFAGRAIRKTLVHRYV